ncbi:uncharacterized protein C8Q71DRAFT_837434 [Rhodofomes roseus]|uniref:Uncharacterized protein n=1 Tax=Rhodofomes roseus TaxID=34475 RepID=A0ABQ8KCZ5_9APHY|nr:uncharacterized protein C8Q71DRAFT_837434 [Rhodofomes roseus]KAH9835471.1 hypothetical protein C8Q71DRAFT_837434 [Rhodofomes roseus]
MARVLKTRHKSQRYFISLQRSSGAYCTRLRCTSYQRSLKIAWFLFKTSEVRNIFPDGLGCRKWSYNDKKQNHGATRLWRILISESAFLIWKLRCERVIGHEEEERWAHSSNELRSRWASTMNQRLHLDAATTHPRFGRKALRRDIYADTWHDAVVDNRALYTHRSREGVLVGIPSAGYELDPG